MSFYTPTTPETSRSDHPFNPDRRDSAAFARPADFDPAEYPILAQHYGIEPPRTKALEVLGDDRFALVSIREVPGT